MTEIDKLLYSLTLLKRYFLFVENHLQSRNCNLYFNSRKCTEASVEITRYSVRNFLRAKRIRACQARKSSSLSKNRKNQYFYQSRVFTKSNSHRSYKLRIFERISKQYFQLFGITVQMFWHMSDVCLNIECVV